MNYRELAPIPELRGVVHCVWLLEAAASPAGDPDPVLPDGRPELILHFGDRFDRLESSQAWSRQARIVFAGQLTSPLLLRPTGRTSVVGVRFLPHGAAAILPLPQHEAAGLTVDVASVCARLERELAQVEGADWPLARAAGDVQRILARWVRPSRIDPRVSAAVAAIDRARGQVSVDALSRRANVTRRHLERRFLDVVGATPKRLARIARFQHALQILQQPGARGADAAVTCGYADQSHFIRDFRHLTGRSPSEHLGRVAGIGDWVSGNSLSGVR